MRRDQEAPPIHLRVAKASEAAALAAPLTTLRCTVLQPGPAGEFATTEPRSLRMGLPVRLRVEAPQPGALVVTSDRTTLYRDRIELDKPVLLDVPTGILGLNVSFTPEGSTRPLLTNVQLNYVVR